MARLLPRVAAALLCTALLVFAAADWCVWQVRLRRGSGTGQVEVSRVTVAELKRNKQEYYFDGTEVLPCTVSLLPQPLPAGWGTPCWWLRRHRSVEVHY